MSDFMAFVGDDFLKELEEFRKNFGKKYSKKIKDVNLLDDTIVIESGNPLRKKQLDGLKPYLEELEKEGYFGVQILEDNLVESGISHSIRITPEFLKTNVRKLPIVVIRRSYDIRILDDGSLTYHKYCLDGSNWPEHRKVVDKLTRYLFLD